MIYDCFLYNGEHKILEARIRELKDIVDIFVIGEGALTLSGNEKEKSDISFLNKYKVKIRHLWYTKDDLKAEDAWERERISRNLLNRGLFDAIWHDDILFSDVDEITYKEILKDKSPGFQHWQIIEFRMYWAYFNIKTFVDRPWIPGMKAIKMQNFRSWYKCDFNDFRSRNAMKPIEIKGAGVHLSYCESPLLKIKSFAHTECNTKDVDRKIKRSLSGNYVFWDKNIKTKQDNVRIPGGFDQL